MRRTKLAEAVVVCIVIGLCSYISVYFADRLWDTHWGLLSCLFCGAITIWILVPLAFYRWVWGSRRWEQVARLLRNRSFNMGDELLSAIELSANATEQARSPELCRAAMRQVAARALSQDLRSAAPGHFLRQLAIVSFVLAGLVAIIVGLYPVAAANSWHRFSRPWNPIARYTFVSVESIPDKWIVPHGEPTSFSIALQPDSARRPDTARLIFGNSSTDKMRLLEAQISTVAQTEPQQPSQEIWESTSKPPVAPTYQFSLPPFTSTHETRLVVGDYSKKISIEPKMRPELTSLKAEVNLPGYLQIGEALQQDVRAGVLAVVEGSRFQLTAEASSDLEFAWVAGKQVAIQGPQFESQELQVGNEPMEIELSWLDKSGLTGRRPFSVQIQPFPDELPSIAAQELPKQAVILESEQVNFRALGADDFGIKQIGIAWKGMEQTLVARPAEGQKVIAGGGPSQPSLQVSATFCAAALGISPQPLEVTIWVEDYSPDHPPVHSAPHLLYILTPDEHAIWITTQISKWQRSALEVKDTELQLFQANQQLQKDFKNQPAQGQLLESLRRQSALEEANARKLNSLTQAGAELLRQAARNPDVAADNIDQMAKMLDVLRDISTNRMPSVADLLKQAAASVASSSAGATTAENALASSASSSSSSKGNPSSSFGAESQPSGQSQGSPDANAQASSSNPSGSESPNNKSESQSGDSNSNSPPDLFNPPSLSDIESNMHSPDALQSSAQTGAEKSGPVDSGRIGLPQTTLMGPSSASSDAQASDQSPPKPQDLAEQKPLQTALKEQLELLAEFEKIADQMNAVLGNLEGSTLVKRLKAASREQSLVAEKIASRIESIFGRSRAVPAEDQTVLDSLSQSQHESSQSLSFIMDDMQAYFDRRKIPEIKSVLDDMKSAEVLASLKKLGDDLPVEHGLSIAQAEYWADTIDRWAEDLVASSDTKSDEASDESKDSLPARFVLEMLKILEGEVNLREETRVAEQACKVVPPEQHQAESQRLSRLQADIQKRTEALADEISALPNAEQNFAQEILLFSTVGQIMQEAQFLLSVGNVGSQTIAAETEVIELLLQSKRVNPQGGGGGGTSPGGGGQGTTDESALALLGAGLNPSERQEARDVGQGVGKANDRVFPEEFRGGLDAYFEMLESRSDSHKVKDSPQ